MPEISFVDPGFRKSLHKKLSIQLSLNGFSFLATGENNKGLAFRHYSFQGLFLNDELIRRASDILLNDSILQAPYQQVNVVYISQKSSLVPGELFDTKNLKKILEFNQAIDDLDEIHYEYINDLDTYNVFTLPNYLSNEIYSHFRNNIGFHHQGSILLQHAYKLNELQPDTSFFVNINKGFFDLAIIKDGGLKLYNSYQYVHPTDFTYFLLYACKELNLEAHKEKFIFMGEHSDNQHIHEQIKNYLGDIKYISGYLNNNISIRKFDTQKFFTLLV